MTRLVEIGPRDNLRPDWIHRNDALFIEIDQDEAKFLRQMYPEANITSDRVLLALSRLARDSVDEIYMKNVLGSQDVSNPNKYITLGETRFPVPRFFYENYGDLVRYAHVFKAVLKPGNGYLTIVETNTPAPKEEFVPVFEQVGLRLIQDVELEENGYQLSFSK